MLTNNYINIRYNSFLGLTGGKTITTPFGSLSSKPLRGANGSNISQFGVLEYDIGTVLGLPRCRAIPTISTSNMTYVTGSYMGVYFGSGSTPVSLEDYTLESPITSGLGFSGGLENASLYENGKTEVIARYIVTNTTSAEINIGEVGCFVPIKIDSSNYYLCTMVDRTVLADPIAIPAGESKMVTYKFVFNQTMGVE